MFEFFQQQRPGALAQHQAVARGVERARRGLRGVVARARGEQRVEHGRLGRVELLGTAGQHRHLAPRTDGLVGVADALAARGAGAGGRQDAAGDAEEHADIDRGGMRHHANVGGRADAFGRAVQQHPAEVGHGFRRAGGRAVGDAELAAGDQRVAIQPGVAQRRLAGQHRHQRDPPHAASALAGVVRRRLELRNGSGELRVQALVLAPVLHPDDGALAGAQPWSHRGPVVAERADGAGTGDDDALHPNIPPLTEITWRVM